MLRRTKGAVAAELPPKVEAIEHIELEPAQANLFEVIRVATEAKVMGQQSTVFVHKLVAQGTLEERIVAMQARKAALAQGLRGDAQATATRLTEGELAWLLQPIGAAASMDNQAQASLNGPPCPPLT